jgi:hypothetical protein
VLDATEQAQLSECKGCRIVIAPVNGSAFLIECVDCIISVAARQIRLRDCVNCELRVWAPSDTALIIETCDHLTLGEWELEYDGLEEQFGLARIDATKPNYWDKVYDFSPSANRSEKHYTLLPKRTGAPVRLDVTPEGLHGGRVVERGADAKTVALLAAVNGAARNRVWAARVGGTPPPAPRHRDQHRGLGHVEGWSHISVREPRHDERRRPDSVVQPLCRHAHHFAHVCLARAL